MGAWQVSTLSTRRGGPATDSLGAGVTAFGDGKHDFDRHTRTGCVANGFAGGGSGWSSDRLLELVRCGGRPPYTPSPSTWSSSRSLRT